MKIGFVQACAVRHSRDDRNETRRTRRFLRIALTGIVFFSFVNVAIVAFRRRTSADVRTVASLPCYANPAQGYHKKPEQNFHRTQATPRSDHGIQ
jgi:hypothetical protein